MKKADAHRDELRGKRGEHGAQGFTWRRAREAAVLVLSKHPAIDGLHLPRVKKTDVTGYRAQRSRLRATPSPWDIKQGRAST